MSGDVQPRKRKDKRRKKEGGSLGNIHEAAGQKYRGRSASEDEDEGVVLGSTDQGESIHVHHDHGIGGNVFVKIVFFCLLAALVGMVGIIFIHSRGSTDVDLPSIEDSRFAEYFTGWLDDAPDDHGHDDHAGGGHSEEEHDDEHDEHDEEEEEEAEDDEHGSEEPAEKSAEGNQQDDDDEGIGTDEDDEDEASTEAAPNAESGDEDDNDDDDDVVEGLPAKESPQPSEEEEEEEEEEDLPPPPPRRMQSQSSQERRGRGAQSQEEADDDDDDNNDNGTEEQQDDNADDHSPENNEVVDNKQDNDDDDDNEDNGDDWTFRQELDFAEDQLDNNPRNALKEFEAILLKNSTILRALIGRAKALDRLAEAERSNAYLKQAIAAYRTVLVDNTKRLKDQTLLDMSARCLDRMKFAGQLGQAIEIHELLIRRFPNVAQHRNDLAVSHLILNHIAEAKSVLQDTLSRWPRNGVALVHYGFILKTSDNDLAGGARYMEEGIRTGEKAVLDGRFFFHLGDALNRLGRGNEAIQWYDIGVKEGLFLSRYQRSLYNVDRLKAQPWWTPQETTYQDFFRKLEEAWQSIRDEGVALLNAKGVNLFKDEAENLKDRGDWKQLDLYFRGRRHNNCDHAPVTCGLIGAFKPASGCRRGQAKFSVMLPNTHVWPHCGPSNCRLRSHLGLVVPPGTFLRVAEDTRSWKEGQVIVFDDSFEHEVWHNGTSVRLVLIVDVWHPQLTNHERNSLSAI